MIRDLVLIVVGIMTGVGGVIFLDWLSPKGLIHKIEEGDK